MKYIRLILIYAVVCLAMSSPVFAQITIPYPTFVNGTTADADQVNANNTALSGAALNRTGGTITGAIVVNAGVTVDGIDIGAVLGGTGTPTFTSVTATGNVGAATMTTSNTGVASLDVGGGLNIGTSNVALVDTTGKITAISSTYFASLSGANLTSLSATNVSSGTLAVARGGTGADLSAVTQGNLIYFSGTGVPAAFAPGASGTFLTSAGAGATPVWTTSGANLTALNASNISSGALGDARLSGTYSSPLTFSSGSNVFTAAYKSADGTAGITSTTCNFTAGTITIKNGLIVAGTSC